jgi:two-component system, cell cycle response regulator
MAEESSKPRRVPDTDTTYNTLDATQAITPLRPADGPQVASLIVLAGWEIGLEFVLREGETIIGRTPTADVSIRLPSVSRQHAKIVHSKIGDAEVYEIADLGSMNGTTVNGAEQQSTVLKNNDKIELGDVVLKFVLQDLHEAQYHRELRRRIEYDQLTGLLTLAAFKRQAEDMIRAAKKSSPLTLAMTDLDGLKRVNDTHGHLAGSAVIKAMGEAIREGLRPSERAGLYGGDDAIVVYPGTSVDEACERAEALRERIAGMTVDYSGKPLNVTISQGLAQWPTHGGGIEPLIAAADGALYAAKAAGRNCVRVCGD